VKLVKYRLMQGVKYASAQADVMQQQSATAIIFTNNTHKFKKIIYITRDSNTEATQAN